MEGLSMIVIDKPFPDICRNCIFWKNQFCLILEKKKNYEEAGAKDPACILKKKVGTEDAFK